MANELARSRDGAHAAGELRQPVDESFVEIGGDALNCAELIFFERKDEASL